MKSIKTKNLDTLIQVIVQISNTLTCARYDQEDYVAIISDGREVNSFSRWFLENWNHLVDNNDKLKIAESTFVGNSGYHFAGEELWITSMEVHNGYLIELVTIRLEDREKDFRMANKRIIEKVYLIPFDN